MSNQEPSVGLAMGAGGFLLTSPIATQALAEQLGALCQGGEVFLLQGDLGSGKTCFIQGLARGLGVPASSRVTSPTFTLHAEYSGRLRLNHFDLYRLEGEVGKANLASLGLDDMLLDPEAVLAVEWPEILGTALGTEALTIQLSHAGEGERWLNPVAAGNKHRDLLSLWQRVAHF